MEKYFFSKTLTIGVIILFTGVSIVSAINSNNENYNIELVNELEYANLGNEIFYPTDDTQIRHGHPDDILGSHDVLKTLNEYGYGGTPGWAVDTLIKFDISSIPSNAQIISAILYLHYQSWGDTNPAGRPLNIYRITSDWNEGTCNWNNQPSYTSTLTTTSIIPSAPGVWMEWDVTSDVETFVSGSIANYGWKITDETYWGKSEIPRTRFWAKEHGSLIPYLEIEVFEPTKAILIGKVTNVDTSSEGFIRFNAEFLRFIQLSPFSFNRYTLGEEILVTDSYRGLLTTKFALGLFDAELWE
jgi:hypothetical protein